MTPEAQKTEESRKEFFDQIKTLFHVEDISGIEVFSTLHRVSHFSETLDARSSDIDEMELSGPRWRLMLRLFMEERRGNPQGLTPTAISHTQRVSKNTISALLRGLEEQGLIQRALDPKDLRIFRIQLTQAGRDFILSTAPKRIQGMNRLLDELTPEEVHLLVTLLEKLQHSLLTQIDRSKREQNRI